MQKPVPIAIAIAIAIAIFTTIFFISGNPFSSPEEKTSENKLATFLPTLVTPSNQKNLANKEDLANEAWQIFQDYLEAARTHNLTRIRALAHQISETCNKPSITQDCRNLMDSVYNITGDFLREEFKHIQFDRQQIILFTDGPVVSAIYFTRDNIGTPKILGIQFCFEDESTDKCIETDPDKRDLDGNGWWDSVEALFY